MANEHLFTSITPAAGFQGDSWEAIRVGDTQEFRRQVENGAWKLQELIELCGGMRTRKEKVFQFGVYQGEVNQQDELSGQGVMTFNDGSYYDGQWRANKRHGLGTFQYASGSSYHGEYK